eukprot:c1862_g1_i1.p1 GENE.c1862_g1_i1~~c1862_g1_i1.p1  ORF type:complete len:300 (-),score=75.74 c1862_g1_i1:15-914(-)
MIATRTRAVRAIYRALVKHCAQIEASTTHSIRLQLPLDPTRWGHGQFVKPEDTRNHYILSKIMPGVNFSTIPNSTDITGAQMLSLVRSTFRSRATPSSSTQYEKWIDDGFKALRELAIQKKMNRLGSVTITNGLEVEALGMYLPHKSAPHNNSYVFAYRLRVANISKRPVQLIGRHWVIETSTGDVKQIPWGSAGVVGLKPQLFPNHVFEYVSGCELDSGQGSMHGSLQIVPLILKGPPTPTNTNDTTSTNTTNAPNTNSSNTLFPLLFSSDSDDIPFDALVSEFRFDTCLVAYEPEDQ